MADDAHVARVLRWLPFMRGKRYVSISQYIQIILPKDIITNFF